jgi:hypothetical protein
LIRGLDHRKMEAPITRVVNNGTPAQLGKIMRKMKCIEFMATVLIGTLLLAGGGCRKPEDLGRLDGKWVGAELTNQNAKCQITIDKGRFEFRGATEADSFSGNIGVLYSETPPGTMDVTVAEPSKLAGETALFIFERKKNELKLAWLPPGTLLRPSNFDPEPGVRIVKLKSQ